MPCANEDFENKADAKRALLENFYIELGLLPFIFKNYIKSYFEDARSSRIRSLLCVNEDFENEADAERALLENFYIELGLLPFIFKNYITRAILKMHEVRESAVYYA